MRTHIFTFCTVHASRDKILLEGDDGGGSDDGDEDEVFALKGLPEDSDSDSGEEGAGQGDDDDGDIDNVHYAAAAAAKKDKNKGKGKGKRGKESESEDRGTWTTAILLWIWGSGFRGGDWTLPSLGAPLTFPRQMARGRSVRDMETRIPQTLA